MTNQTPFPKKASTLTHVQGFQEAGGHSRGIFTQQETLFFGKAVSESIFVSPVL